jgi:signal transduction histidine kinase
MCHSVVLSPVRRVGMESRGMYDESCTRRRDDRDVRRTSGAPNDTYADAVDRLRRGIGVVRTHQARVRDVLVILATLGNGPLISVGSNSPEENPDLPLVTVVSTVCAVVLWWRRRHPLAAAVVGVVAYAVAAVPIPLGAGLATLAVRRRDRVLVALTAAGYVAYVGNGVVVGDQDLAASAVTGVLYIGVWVAVGAYVGARRDLLASMRERAERAEAEQSLRAEQARLAERTRIAGEMHDVLAHRMSLVALHAGGLEVNEAVDRAAVQRSAELIRRTAREALEDLRDVLGVLRDPHAEAGTVPQPTLADLPRLIESSRAAGVTVELVDDTGGLSSVPESVGRAAYRVAQEALTNVHKHARGAPTCVRLGGRAGERLTVDVTNVRPVSAGSLLPGSGYGLVGLRERVQLAGGQVAAAATEDGGWQVHATLPWPLDGREGAR